MPLFFSTHLIYRGKSPQGVRRQTGAGAGRTPPAERAASGPNRFSVVAMATAAAGGGGGSGARASARLKPAAAGGQRRLRSTSAKGRRWGGAAPARRGRSLASASAAGRERVAAVRRRGHRRRRRRRAGCCGRGRGALGGTEEGTVFPGPCPEESGAGVSQFLPLPPVRLSLPGPRGCCEGAAAARPPPGQRR